MANRLATETSPYLLQHAENPVDWFPWGEEALARARAEDKPILLSIGYAACHWCHVMERESFEDHETARLMNEWFVCVKVDREERPDLDSIYMAAVQAMTGHGGWPMTVFLTPDGRPFFGGTYFPPEDRQGMPAFGRVLQAVQDAWVNRREEIEQQSGELTEYISRATQLRESPDPISEQVLDQALRGMLQQLDREWGGFGTGMKFPQPMTVEFLLRMHARGHPDALGAVTLTLDKMARGGLFDQIGGGFHRYTVDRIWLVPHFEKMLYDNAQLIRLYARAWQVTGSELYRETALRTGEYLLREMRHPEGGFYSSQDADSEGVEGKFYVWPYEEFIAVTAEDMPAAVAAFAVSGDGNWEGTNVPWRPEPDEQVAERIGMSVHEFRASVERARRRLFEGREARVRPGTDDKILASWNGLAIAGLAEAGRALATPEFVDAAARAAGFVLSALRRDDGRLLRSWRDGRAGGAGFLDDYALMADACLTLYETTFERRWWNACNEIVRAMIELFSDLDHGGFYDTGTDVPATVIRPKDVFDSAMPSGNSAAADVLLRVAALRGDADLEREAVSFLRTIAPALAQSPLGFGHALGALDRYLSRAVEVAIVGAPEAEETRRLVDVALERYLPNRVIAVGPPGTTEPALLRERPILDGATAYVCRDFACRQPVTSPEALQQELFGRSGP